MQICCVEEAPPTAVQATFMGQNEKEQEDHLNQRTFWKDHLHINYRRALSIALILLVILIGVITILAILFESSKKPCINLHTLQDQTFRPPCEDGWIFYIGKCFFFSEDDGSWDHGKSFCASYNASLAAVGTQKELDFMMRYKGVDDHWIGLKRDHKQPWKWSNATEFNNWFKIKGDSNCAYLNHEGVRNARCYADRKWICTTGEDYLKNGEYVLPRGASHDNTKDF